MKILLIGIFLLEGTFLYQGIFKNFILQKNLENKYKFSLNTIKKMEVEILELDKKISLLEKEKSNEEDVEYNSFASTTEFFQFIENLCERDEVEIEVVGRDYLEKFSDQSWLKGNYFEIRGEEKNIFKFLRDIDKNDFCVGVEKNNFLIEKNENYINLSMELMYIVNNKLEKNEIIFEREKIFKNNKRILYKERRGL